MWMSRSRSIGAVTTLTPEGVRSSRELVAMAQEVDSRRRWSDPFVQQLLADQRVDECAFPRVELPDDDQQEDIVQLRDRGGDGSRVCLSGRGEGERFTQIAHHGARLGQLAVGNSAEHS